MAECCDLMIDFSAVDSTLLVLTLVSLLIAIFVLSRFVRW